MAAADDSEDPATLLSPRLPPSEEATSWRTNGEPRAEFAREIGRRLSAVQAPQDKALPPGWEAVADSLRTYYLHAATGATQWDRPASVQADPAALSAELAQVQEELRSVSENSRTLTITLYLTGCKPEQLKPEANPASGSTGELVKAL